MQAVWTKIRTNGKKLNLKKESRRQQKYEKLPSMQRVKERFDARAISAIRRRAVKAQLKLHSWPEPHLPYFVTHAISTYFSLAGLLLMCNQ